MCAAVVPMDSHLWELARVVIAMPYDEVCRTAVFKKVTQLYNHQCGEEGPTRYSLQSATLADSERDLDRMREHVAHCPGVHYSSEARAFIFASFDDVFDGALSLLRAAAAVSDQDCYSNDVPNEKLAIFEAFMRRANNVIDVMVLGERMEQLM